MTDTVMTLAVGLAFVVFAAVSFWLAFGPSFHNVLLAYFLFLVAAIYALAGGVLLILAFVLGAMG